MDYERKGSERCHRLKSELTFQKTTYLQICKKDSVENYLL